MIIKTPKNFLLKNCIIDDDMEQNYKNNDIEVDDCLAEEIQELWEKGIHTRGCCCGHSKETGFIQVERTDLGKMIELGYQWYHEYPEELGGYDRHDAFIPHSKCKCGKEN